ncbi:alpha/beta hydrolase [Allofrancisella frigidaquae]|uniref:Alpha/beta hydrolase n=2 Tax=Allofrancisella frigidaquae TaxID=1085644 RepID=A0A6M3HUA4_9GAMM|nr:alpha/beta hydrolase [Allofrancisella frigidaquae]
MELGIMLNSKKLSKIFAFALICLLFVFVTSLISKNAKNSNLVSSDYYISYGTQKIHLKEKKLTTKNTKDVIMLINPLSIPSIVAFDVPNHSLMDSLAESGYDVWAIDFIGEGKSSYPKIMQIDPAPKGTYPLQATQAIKQLDKAIDFVLNKTQQKNMAILGWSWGSVVAAMYTTENPHKVSHLVLYGSMYSSRLEKPIEPMFIQPFAGINDEFNEELPDYQNIPWQMIKHHWQMMLKDDKSIVSDQTINQVGKAYINIDPAPYIPDSLRRPMGPMKDLYSIWNGKPIYDISKLTTPTLVIYGDQDLFADKELYSKLTNVKIKQEVKIKHATHWLIYEKARDQFIQTMLDFLDKK